MATRGQLLYAFLITCRGMQAQASYAGADGGRGIVAPWGQSGGGAENAMVVWNISTSETCMASSATHRTIPSESAKPAKPATATSYPTSIYIPNDTVRMYPTAREH